MRSLRFLVLAAALTATSAGSSFGQQADSNDFVCKLDPNCPVRPGFRKLAIDGPIPDEPLTVNLYIGFQYDSANLQSDALIILDKLGAALKDSRLSGFAFEIDGHTDAKGSDDYNQGLSERRAGTVKTYLISKFGIDPARLTSKGMGRMKLLDPSHPEDGVNRRVQVLNVTARQ